MEEDFEPINYDAYKNEGLWSIIGGFALGGIIVALIWGWMYYT